MEYTVVFTFTQDGAPALGLLVSFSWRGASDPRIRSIDVGGPSGAPMSERERAFLHRHHGTIMRACERYAVLDTTARLDAWRVLGITDGGTSVLLHRAVSDQEFERMCFAVTGGDNGTGQAVAAEKPAPGPPVQPDLTATELAEGAEPDDATEGFPQKGPLPFPGAGPQVPPMKTEATPKQRKRRHANTLAKANKKKKRKAKAAAEAARLEEDMAKQIAASQTQAADMPKCPDVQVPPSGGVGEASTPGDAQGTGKVNGALPDEIPFGPPDVPPDSELGEDGQPPE